MNTSSCALIQVKHMADEVELPQWEDLWPCRPGVYGVKEVDELRAAENLHPKGNLYRMIERVDVVVY